MWPEHAMSFLPHATLDRDDREYLQSQLLSQCVTPPGWLCHPVQTHGKAEPDAVNQPTSAPELNLSSETNTARKKH